MITLLNNNMRTIKFRAPIECKNCKFKGFQYFEWNGQSFTPSGYDKCECEKLEIAGEPQQFTGLKDKNGKDIYEGDIVAMFGNILEVKYGEQNIGQDFQGVGFYTQRIGTDGADNIFGGDSIRIVGNIHEYPELLNK